MEAQFMSLIEFAKKAKLSTNCSRELVFFLHMFSGHENWPNIARTLVDEDVFNAEEIETIEKAHQETMTFDIWYSEYSKYASESLKLKLKDPTRRDEQWVQFVNLFKAEEFEYQNNVTHLTAVYLSMYHDSYKEKRGYVYGHDDEEDRWLVSCVGEKQLLKGTVDSIEAFPSSNPSLSERSFFDLAECVCIGYNESI
jgi:hypothetical protein